MRRFKELTFLSLAILVTVSFVAQYAVTASAPGTHEDLVSDTGSGFAQGRGSVIQQIIRSTPLLSTATVATVPAEANVAELKSDVPPVETSNVSDIQSDTLLPIDLLSSPFDPMQQPAADGNYCDPSFVGAPITFAQ